MKAKYPGKCACGAEVEKGFEVRMEQVFDPFARWRIVECPACNEGLSRGRADVAKSEITLAEALRRREIREMRKRGIK